MFFHWSNFSDHLTENQAILTAKIANEIINTKGVVLTGNERTDGSFVDFSTEKKTTDTHVAILLGSEMMGSMKPSEVPIKVEGPSKDDILRATIDHNNELKRMLAQQRGGNA